MAMHGDGPLFCIQEATATEPQVCVPIQLRCVDADDNDAKATIDEEGAELLVRTERVWN